MIDDNIIKNFMCFMIDDNIVNEYEKMKESSLQEINILKDKIIIDGYSIHKVGDSNCDECWEGYPVKCECGGLIHACFGDENGSGDYWLYFKCDICEDTTPSD